MRTFKVSFIVILCMLFSLQSFGQRTVTGKVTSADEGFSLIGVNVVVKGTSIGTATDINGDYSIEVPNGSSILSYSYIGYENVDVPVDDRSVINVGLYADERMLDELVIVGTRFNPRSVITSAVPIDNISIDQLKNSGQTDVDQMLTYAAPSYNSTQQTISDATAHFNPAELRGLGPGRTLVLINGKRKNQSALVYINDTPGKGEVGVDMKSIPAAAIERIEVLRDGASAQYGSDAIAGVVNIILKDDYEYAEVNIGGGFNTAGESNPLGAVNSALDDKTIDGETISVDANFGFKIGSKGFANVTAAYLDQGKTNRPGNVTEDPLFGVNTTPGDPNFSQWLVDNPDMGMIVGQPEMTKNDVMFNGKYDLNGIGEAYAFGGVTFRKGRSWALRRTPYWNGGGSTYGGQGFHPTFDTDIFDNTLALGLRGAVGLWNWDLSTMTGSNTVDYTVEESYNNSLGAQSPTIFDVGGYEFRHRVNNLDLSRSWDQIGLGFGMEFRTENFVANGGEENSYIGGGAQSFPGVQPANEVDKNRYNVGFYGDMEWTPVSEFLLGLAGRYENYSDFGDNFSGKGSARYTFGKVNVRASVSTGFRAPSLHQIYLSNIQTLVSGGTISNQGTFNNQSPVIAQLGVPQLKEETSLNYGGGLTFQVNDNFTITGDYYHIDVDDRVVFTGALTGDDGDPLNITQIEQILLDQSVTSIKFFINGIDTETDGVDVVANYTDIPVGLGSIDVSLAGNYNKTSIVGELNTPDQLAGQGDVLFDRKERSRIESARPQDKVLLGLTYKNGDFQANLNNTRFGEVTWRHAQVEDLANDVPDRDQTFEAKIITDLFLSYNLSESINFGIGSNNLLDVYPDKIDTKGDPVTDLGGRFVYPWEVNQFGFNGRYVFGKLRIRL